MADGEDSIDRGIAGNSARREYERRVAKRADSTNNRHPHVGRVLLALTDEPRSSRAWDKGAHGEQRVGRKLERILGGEGIVLHDRRIPGRRSNIDHVLIGPAGVFVVDTKSYQGKVERRMAGSLLARKPRLFIGDRDRTNLVDGVTAQAAAVRASVTADLPVQAVLCITRADWGFTTSPFTIEDVWIAWAKALVKRACRTQVLDPEQIRKTAAQIAADFTAKR